MANTKVNMQAGKMRAEGQTATTDRAKLRLKSVPADMKERLRDLDKRKQALAAKRGKWSGATAKQRADARAVAAEIAEVKAEMRAASDAQRQAELDKQAAAAKREAARKAES